MRRNKDRAWNSFRENPTSENLNYATLKDKSYSEEEFRLKLEYEKRLTNDLKIIARVYIAIYEINEI